MRYDYFDASWKMIMLFAKGRPNFVKIAKEDIERLKKFSEEYSNDLKLEIEKSSSPFYMKCRYVIAD